MTRPAEPDCPRWRALRAHLHHITKRDIAAHAAVHAWSCPVCCGWTVPPNLSRDLERTKP